jgi:calcineurin-like phosphoesterase family protein
MVAAVAVAAWFGVVSTAHASICTSIKDKQGTTGTVCITSVQPENGVAVSPTAGTPVTVMGNTKITATVTYSPAPPPAGEVRGCYGERLTPSGCLTWLHNGNYTLTQLYATSGVQGNRTYTWTWGTSQYPNGSSSLDAQAQLDDAPIQAVLKVNINNNVPGSFPSPIANGGKLPIFGKTTYPFTVAAFGDGPAGSTMTQNVANLVHSWNPDMLMYLGDVYQRGMPDEFMNFYNPLYGPDAHRTITTVGNHEYKELSNAQGYFWYWNFPNGSPSGPAGGKPGGGTGGGSWYSLDVGGPLSKAWHIISLNSNVPMTSTSPQGTWLQKDLAADVAARPKSGHPCSLAFWHAARFSDISLRLPSTSALWSQLYPYGDDLIINAHSHAYERWQPLNNSGQVTTQSKGITEFIVGTGGNVLAQVWNTNDNRSAMRERTAWGALKLELYATYAKYSFYETNGSLFDTGTVTCR